MTVISLERESNRTTLVCAKCPEAVTHLSCLHCSVLENKHICGLLLIASGEKKLIDALVVFADCRADDGAFKEEETVSEPSTVWLQSNTNYLGSLSRMYGATIH